MMSVLAPDLKITARASYKVFWSSKSFCYHFCDFLSDKVQQRFFSVLVNFGVTLQLPETAAWTDVFPSPSGTSVAAPWWSWSLIIIIGFELYFRRNIFASHKFCSDLMIMLHFQPCREETEPPQYVHPPLLCIEESDQHCPGWYYLKIVFSCECFNLINIIYSLYRKGFTRI